MAATIGIVDEADCYVSDEVEGALQELCSGSGAGRLNGLIAGGTFSELACAPNGVSGGVHATLTLCAPTEIMMNGTVLDAAGLTVSLPAVNTVYFIYLDTQVSSPTYRELVAATGSPPQIEEGIPNATVGPDSIEQVMLAKVTMDGAGNIVSWQDARFFVRNLDRKVQYSSRQGENVDAWSEGCFANLQAFFFWAEFYGDGALASSNEDEKGTILIRGTHSITAALTVPTDHLQFVGDGEAVIELNGIAAPYAAFETSRSDITFRNITFKTNLSGCIGISASGTYSDVTVEDCRFLTGTANFNIALSFMGGPANERILVRDCYIEAENTGVQADGFGSTNAFGIRAEDCTVKGFGQASSKGFILGTGTASGSAYITGCSVKDMETGIYVNATSSTEISGCSIIEAVTGIRFADVFSLTHKITNNTIVLTDNLSLHGIYVGKGNTQINISGNYIRSMISGGHPSEPYGIGLDVDAGAGVLGLTITNNNIIGFYDATNNRGHGIAVFAVATQGTGASITANTLSRCDIAVTQVSDLTITGNSINAQGVWSGSPGPTVGAGISTAAASLVTITGNNISCGAVIPNGIEVRQGRHLTVTANNVVGPAENGILASATLKGGLGAAFMEHFTITGNAVDGWLGAGQPPAANGILVGLSSDNGAPERGVIDGNNVQKCGAGIVLQGFSVDVPVHSMLVTNNIVAECALDQDTYDRLSWVNSGSKGIGFQYGKDITVQGNIIRMIGVVRNPATGTPITFPNGIYARPIYSLNSTVVTVDNNTVSASSSFGPGDSMDISHNLGVLAGDFVSRLVQITDNKISSDDTHNPGTHRCVSVFGEESVHQIGLQDIAIRGNTINSVDGPSGDGFGFGVSVFAGSFCRISGCSIDNNAVESYLVLGIQVALLNATPQGDVEMRNLRIRGNTVQSMGSAGPIAGIAIEQSARTAFSSKLSKVSVEGNTIQKGWGDGISVAAIATTATTGFAGLDTVTISGNLVSMVKSAVALGAAGVLVTIKGGVSERIRTGADLPAPWSKDGVQDITVKDNIITDVVRSIDINADDCPSCTRLTVENNESWGNGTDALGASGDFLSRIEFLLSDNDHTQDIAVVSVCGNKMMVSEGQNRTVNGLVVNLLNTNVSVVSVQGNTINASGQDAKPETHGRSIQWNSKSLLGGIGPLSYRETILADNILGGSVSWTIEEADVYTVDMHGNQISTPPVTEGTYSDVISPLWVNVDGLKFDGLTFQGFSANGNTLTGGVLGLALTIADMKFTNMVSIVGNTISENHQLGIAMLVDQVGGVGFFTDEIRETQIKDNILANHSNSGDAAIGILYMAGRADTKVLDISGNTLRNYDAMAIRCRFGGGNADGNQDRNIRVDSNLIDMCATDASALPVIELGPDPLQTFNVLADISQVSVSGNTLTYCGAVTGSIGIYVDFTEYNTAYDLHVDGNMMGPTSAGAFGPPTARLGSGIELDLPRADRATVSGNSLSVYGFDGTAGYGIYVQSFNSQIDDLVVDGNVMGLGADVEAGVRIRFMDPAGLASRRVSITNNHLESHLSGVAAVDYGIMSSDEGGVQDSEGFLREWQITGNTIKDCSVGVHINYGYLGARCAISAYNNVVDSNQISGFNYGGILWSTGGISDVGRNTLGLSVSRNTLQTGWDNQTDDAMIRVKAGRSKGLVPGVDSGVSVHMVSIDGNHCYCTDPPDGTHTEWSGVVLEVSVISQDAEAKGGSMGTISLNDNHVRNCGAIGVGMELHGFYMIDGNSEVTVSSNADCLSMSGNLIKRPRPMPFMGCTSVILEGVHLRQFAFQNNQVESDGAVPLTSNSWGMYFKNDWGTATTNVNFLGNRWTVTGNCSKGPDYPDSSPVLTDWSGFEPNKGTVAQNLCDVCAGNHPFTGTNWNFGNQNNNLVT
jgi:hypothetical protein